MNTDKFDKHATDNLAFYVGFMNLAKIGTFIVVATLALMAGFLL